VTTSDSSLTSFLICSFVFIFLSFRLLPCPLISTLFPYTTLFRSHIRQVFVGLNAILHCVLKLVAGLYHPFYTADSRHKRKCYGRSEEHTSELQSRFDLVCRLLLEKKNNKKKILS